MLALSWEVDPADVAGVHKDSLAKDPAQGSEEQMRKGMEFLHHLHAVENGPVVRIDCSRSLWQHTHNCATLACLVRIDPAQVAQLRGNALAERQDLVPREQSSEEQVAVLRQALLQPLRAVLSQQQVV
jgi:hypothetical protein